MDRSGRFRQVWALFARVPLLCQYPAFILPVVGVRVIISSNNLIADGRFTSCSLTYFLFEPVTFELANY
jgi:hypothetical protein